MMVLQFHNIACSKAQEGEPWALKKQSNWGYPEGKVLYMLVAHGREDDS